jgi:hypothetical protein
LCFWGLGLRSRELVSMEGYILGLGLGFTKEALAIYLGFLVYGGTIRMTWVTLDLEWTVKGLC